MRAPERETDNGKERVEPDATDNTNAMRCTCIHDMNESHTRTQQNDEHPKDKEPGMELMKLEIYYISQKGKYYIRGITNSPLLQKDLVPRSRNGKRKGTRNEDDLLVPR